MAKYANICSDWFYLLHSKGLTYEEYESQQANEDRARTEALLSEMFREVPATAGRVLGLQSLSVDRAGLVLLDRALTAAAVGPLLARSDPEDRNNDFVLTISEFAVFVGEVTVARFGASWHYARMPNYFQSTIRVGTLEFQVFDSVMKKVSDDFGHESLAGKFDTFATLIQKRVS